ncbi:hypothetical protein ABZ442_20165 [Streptomyces triculaminicus]|uniref:hypothetical protein n=1 Tax=Streptomyces triculaminicus TaxID=2816232 RepID=UPI0033FEBD5C
MDDIAALVRELVAASTPSLDVLLVSASSPRHWAEARDAAALSLGAKRLREITDVLAAP